MCYHSHKLFVELSGYYFTNMWLSILTSETVQDYNFVILDRFTSLVTSYFNLCSTNQMTTFPDLFLPKLGCKVTQMNTIES